MVTSGKEEQTTGAQYTKIICGEVSSIRYLCFQTAAAAMLGASAVTLVVAMRSDTSSTLLLLAPAVCIVAFLNYNSMVGVHKATIDKCRLAPQNEIAEIAQNGDFKITLLRYADWLITMPLLAVETLFLAQGTVPTTQLGWTSWLYMPAVVAILAFLMILSGLLALMSAGDFDQCRNDTTASGLARWSFLSIGVGCMVGIFVILFQTAAVGDQVYFNEVVSFSALWSLYPVVSIAQIFGLSSALKDILFSVLDVLTKAVFSTVIALMVTGLH